MRERLVEVMAQLDDIAALCHGDADTERFLALPAHLLLRRVHIAARHRGDVAEAEDAVVGADRDRAHRVERVEGARGTQVDAVAGGIEHARRRDGVLLGQRLDDLRRLDAQRGQARVGDLDEDLLVLLADEVDLGHTRHAQELGADAVAERLQVLVREAVTGDGVYVGVRVTELVVEERTLDAGRQRLADVTDALAHLVERVRHLRHGRAVLDREEHLRFAGLRVAAHEVDVRHFLQLALDAVGDLQLDVARGGARPVGAHHHDLERERRVLGLPEALVRQHARDREHDQQVQDERAVMQRPFGQVEA
jgi:hypothetical protein